jgi:hypothetical protein
MLARSCSAVPLMRLIDGALRVFAAPRRVQLAATIENRLLRPDFTWGGLLCALRVIQ